MSHRDFPIDGQPNGYGVLRTPDEGPASCTPSFHLISLFGADKTPFWNAHNVFREGTNHIEDIATLTRTPSDNNLSTSHLHLLGLRLIVVQDERKGTGLPSWYIRTTNIIPLLHHDHGFVAMPSSHIRLRRHQRGVVNRLAWLASSAVASRNEL